MIFFHGLLTITDRPTLLTPLTTPGINLVSGFNFIEESIMFFRYDLDLYNLKSQYTPIKSLSVYGFRVGSLYECKVITEFIKLRRELLEFLYLLHLILT